MWFQKKSIRKLSWGLKERESLQVPICIFKGVHIFAWQVPSCGTNFSEILFSRLPALPSLLQTPFLQIDPYDFPCIAACMLAPQYSWQTPPAQLFFHGKILLLLQINTTEGRYSPSHGSQHLRTFGKIFMPENKITFSQVQLDKQINGNILCFV